MTEPTNTNVTTEEEPGSKSVVLPPIVDLSASVEALMSQALDKAMFRVATELDSCLDTILKPKATAVLKKIATNNAATAEGAHNVSKGTELADGVDPTHNVPSGTGTSDGNNLINAADVVQVVHQRGATNMMEIP